MAKKYIDANKMADELSKVPWYEREDEKQAVRMVKEFPAADVAPQWIPVTERLPEEEGQYLVSCDTDYGVEVGRFYIDEDGERYFGCDWNNPEDIEAWMPLPTPYK